MVTVQTEDGRLVTGVPVWPDETKELVEGVDLLLWEHSYYPGLEGLAGDPEGVLPLLEQWEKWLEAMFGFRHRGEVEPQPQAIDLT